ncbi:MAG: LysM peptidoglycan-binding domain-containing protein [Planctomycetes bacterium]|nr:LysM peptidoglycan-binding domain-containing protein [Planctomycetota bacterium]
MINNNAVRHLALIVSILLCFFIYIGYRFRSSAESPSENNRTSAPDLPIPAVSSAAASSNSDPAMLMTARDGLPRDNPAVSIPSELAQTVSDAQENRRNAEPDISSLLDSGAAYQEPGGKSATAATIPPGSIEEALSASSSSVGNTGVITGLIPDPSRPRSSVAPPPNPETRPPEEEKENQLSLPPPPRNGNPPVPTESELRLATAPSPQSPSGDVAPPVSRTGGTGTPNPARPLTAPTGNQPAERATPPSSGSQPDVAGGVAPSDSLRIYVIRSGDTLSRIAVRELGSITLADNIFLLNRDVISDPNHLVIGDRIRLPIRESLAAAGPGFPPTQAGAVNRPPIGVPASASQPVPFGNRTHQVARGETLSSIARQYYGSSSGWRFLYESNRNSIASPNQLSVGMTLVIPPYSESY